MRQLHLNIKPAVKALELTSKTVLGTLLLGHYASVFRGRGLEFKSHERYTVMDDMKYIDWNASLKSNTLLMKTYTEERSIPMFFIIDSGGSMVYTSTDKLKAEYSGEFVASLAYIMTKQNDLVGFAMVNKKVASFSHPSSGMVQFFRLVESLVRKSNYGSTFNLTLALDFAFKSSLKPKTFVFVVSDFINLSAGWEEALVRASSKFEVIGVMVRDPADFVLPKSLSKEILVSSPSSGKIMGVDLDSVRERYREYVEKQALYVREVFYRCNADFLFLRTDKSFISPLLGFLAARKRRRWK